MITFTPAAQPLNIDMTDFWHGFDFSTPPAPAARPRVNNEEADRLARLAECNRLLGRVERCPAGYLRRA